MGLPENQRQAASSDHWMEEGEGETSDEAEDGDEEDDSGEGGGRGVEVVELGMLGEQSMI